MFVTSGIFNFTDGFGSSLADGNTYPGSVSLTVNMWFFVRIKCCIWSSPTPSWSQLVRYRLGDQMKYSDVSSITDVVEQFLNQESSKTNEGEQWWTSQKHLVKGIETRCGRAAVPSYIHPLDGCEPFKIRPNWDRIISIHSPVPLLYSNTSIKINIFEVSSSLNYPRVFPSNC